MTSTQVELKTLDVDNLDSYSVTSTNLSINGKDIDQYITQGNKLNSFFTIDKNANTLTMKSPYTTFTTTMDGYNGTGKIVGTTADLISVSNISNLTNIQPLSGTNLSILNNNLDAIRLASSSGTGRFTVNKTSAPSTSYIAEIIGTFRSNGLQINTSSSTSPIVATTDTSTGTTFNPYQFLYNTIASGGKVRLIQGRNNTTGNYSQIDFVYLGNNSSSNYISINVPNATQSIPLKIYSDRVTFDGPIINSSTTGLFETNYLVKSNVNVMSMILNTSQNVTGGSTKFDSVYGDFDNGTLPSGVHFGFYHPTLEINYYTATGIFQYYGTTTRYFQVYIQTHFNVVQGGERSCTVRESANNSVYLAVTTMKGTENQASTCIPTSFIWKATNGSSFDVVAGANVTSALTGKDTSGRFNYIMITPL